MSDHRGVSPNPTAQVSRAGFSIDSSGGYTLSSAASEGSAWGIARPRNDTPGVPGTQPYQPRFATDLHQHAITRVMSPTTDIVSGDDRGDLRIGAALFDPRTPTRGESYQVDESEVKQGNGEPLTLLTSPSMSSIMLLDIQR